MPYYLSKLIWYRSSNLCSQREYLLNCSSSFLVLNILHFCCTILSFLQPLINMSSAETQPLFNSRPSTVPTIPVKLEGSNCFQWKNVMTPLLTAYQLLGYADGSIPPPPETITSTVDGKETSVPNPEFQKWKIQDQFALTCILIAVNNAKSSTLIGVNPAKHAWSTLATLFESQTAAQ